MTYKQLLEHVRGKMTKETRKELRELLGVDHTTLARYLKGSIVMGGDRAVLLVYWLQNGRYLRSKRRFEQAKKVTK